MANSPRRDLEVWKLKKEGHGVADIGRIVGISKQLAHIAFKRTERILQNDNLGGSLFLSSRARRAVGLLTDSGNPSLPDLRRSMMWWNDKGGWAAHLLAAKGFGQGTVDELAKFCRENGVEEEIVSPKREGKRWSEPPPDRERVSDSHILAVELSPRALSALETVLGMYPTLEDVKQFIECNPGWRRDLLRLKNCGRTTVRELERFAVEKGINHD